MRYASAFFTFSILQAAFICLGIAHNRLFAANCPCDIYAEGGTPCVAAHSTVRALYSSYTGPLYQVRRKSDTTQKKDIYPLTPGGYANAAIQDSFLNGRPGSISIIYDQSPKGNHLIKGTGGRGPIADLKAPDTEAIATALKVKVGGHPVYALFTTPRCGYRNNNATGLATGDQPEGMYMVASGKHVSDKCCFDYGNACRNDSAGPNGTLETIYFGTCTWWGGGNGSGPWVMGDLENGLYAGGTNGVNQNNTSLPHDYVTAMLKGKPGTWALRGGNAQSGSLKTMYDGARPAGYGTMLKQGGIVLGIGGDNSNWGEGTFFEGCITTGYPADSTENAVQANIVAAGYGSSVVSTRRGAENKATACFFKVCYKQSKGITVIRYTLPDARHVDMKVFDQQGRRIATINDGVVPAGRQTAIWDAKRVSAGIYVCKVVVDGTTEWAANVVVGR